MPAVLVSFFIKFGVSLAINLLEKTGVINKFEALGLKTGTHIMQIVSNTKTYSNNDQLNPKNSDFPEQKNNNGR